jgi:hypothetical protein
MEEVHATSTFFNFESFITHTYSSSEKSYIRCIQIHSLVIMSNGNIYVDVVANHGEDLRFPISSSSGFSSPFFSFGLHVPFDAREQVSVKGPCRKLQGFFLAIYPHKSDSIHTA